MTEGSGGAPPASRGSAALEAASAVVLALLIGVFAFQGSFDREVGGFGDFRDHNIATHLSRAVERDGRYPPQFVHPPPEVVLRLLVARAGPTPSGLLWMGSLVVGLAAALAALGALLGHAGSAVRWRAALASVVAVAWCVQWDLRAVSSNSSFLALLLGSLLALQRGRAGWAGFLLASSVAFRGYSVVVLPYWLWRGRHRAVAAACAWSVFYFALVPALYFGPAGALAISRSWLDALAVATEPGFVESLIAYKVSVRHALAAAVGPGGLLAGLGLAPQPAETLHRLARAVGIAGATGVLLYLAWERRHPWRLEPGGRDLVAVGLLMLAMLAASPLAQPHHGVLLLIPSAVLTREVLDPRRGPRWRLGLAALLASSAIAFQQGPPPQRALVFVASLPAFAAALVVVRARAGRAAATAR